jgi:TRAP-type C4-dicarboxylate transport system substrate-binding protein
MSKSQSITYLSVLGLGLVALVFFSSVSAQSSPEPTVVRWLLAHEPTDVYARAIDVFAEELEKESGGRMKLETVTPAQLAIEGQTSNEQIMQLLESGSVELSSTFGIANGTLDARFWAWQLPFLFENYGDVERAFGSETGETLLTGLSERSPVHALAYTLSGGFRIIASKDAIQSLEDLKGLRIATAGGPVAEETLRAIGAIPVMVGADDADNVGDADAIETTYARISSVAKNDGYTKYILETNHSLFLTTLVASDQFFNSLSAEDQQALTRAARTAAAIERADAVTLNANVKAQLETDGSTVTPLSTEDHEAFVRVGKNIYDSFVPLLGETPTF